MSDELHETLELANRLLDEPYADPDDDLRKLSRHLIREHELFARYKKVLQMANGFLIMNNLEPVKLTYERNS